MKPLYALILLACIMAFTQTMAFNDESADQSADTTCSTDSECEGVHVQDCGDNKCPADDDGASFNRA
jgi:hypothetical protein